jgi:hypothetical protein
MNLSLNGCGQQGISAVCRYPVAVFDSSNQAMKMYIRAGQNQKDITCMITRVVEGKANDRCATILLLDGLEREVVCGDGIGHGIINTILLIRHSKLPLIKN